MTDDATRVLQGVDASRRVAWAMYYAEREARQEQAGNPHCAHCVLQAGSLRDIALLLRHALEQANPVDDPTSFDRVFGVVVEITEAMRAMHG
jgi:hypothetical protein